MPRSRRFRAFSHDVHDFNSHHGYPFSQSAMVNDTLRFDRAFKKVAKRFWQYSSLDDKLPGRWEKIERFAKYLALEHNISIQTAWELSTEYWKGRSS